MCGIPGSGKSSYIKKTFDDVFKVSPDDIRREILGDVNNQSNGNIVFKSCFLITNLAAKSNNVVFDATNTTDKAVNAIIKNCGDNFDEIIVIKIECEKELAFNRIQEDIKKGKDRADVPYHVITRMYNNFKNLKLNNEKINQVWEL